MNKKIYLLFCLFILSSILIGCDLNKSTEEIEKENKVYVKDAFRTLGYLEFTSKWNDNEEIIEIIEEKESGCQYLYNISYNSLSVYMGSDGLPKGCKNSKLIDSKEKKVTKNDYLKLLKEYYPDKDDSELSYILESFLNYKNKSLEETRSILDNLTENTDKDIKSNSDK